MRSIDMYSNSNTSIAYSSNCIEDTRSSMCVYACQTKKYGNAGIVSYSIAYSSDIVSIRGNTNCFYSVYRD